MTYSLQFIDFDFFLPEKVHNRFCKFILGVNKYTSNKADLGRYPLIIFALLQSVKYWPYLNENPLKSVIGILTYPKFT